jgi:hypothetical protein
MVSSVWSVTRETGRKDVTKAGSAQVILAIPSHSAENIGDADCKQIFVEKK